MPETNKTSSATKRTNTTNTETKKKVVKKVGKK